ncbi:MAG: peptidase M15 [Verrucomicrobia bacterium]|nr:MAG: peptidase M15 [Verrucomicrobiota bacterium]
MIKEPPAGGLNHLWRSHVMNLLRISLLFLAAALETAFSGEGSSLVNVRSLNPPPLEEIRYATPYNFTGTRLYPVAAAFVHADAARALEAVQRELAQSGLGLKVYDAYRPLSVQKQMWNLIGDERFVSNPYKGGGRHTRGTAVDVTLVDARGNELPMPSNFDEFSPRAFRNYRRASPEQKRNSQRLQNIMVRHGFIGFPSEWWHFDLRGWEKYPILDVSLLKLDRRSR